MENEKKARGRWGYKKDFLYKVISEYGDGWMQIKQQIEELATGASFEKTNKPIKIQPPNFVEVVFRPLVAKLAELFPEYDINVPGKGDVEPDKNGYFLVQAGERVIIGINFGGADAKHIKVTLFPHNRPWGNPLLIDSMGELKKIIELVIKIVSVPRKKQRDEAGE